MEASTCQPVEKQMISLQGVLVVRIQAIRPCGRGPRNSAGRREGTNVRQTRRCRREMEAGERSTRAPGLPCKSHFDGSSAPPVWLRWNGASHRMARDSRTDGGRGSQAGSDTGINGSRQMRRPWRSRLRRPVHAAEKRVTLLVDRKPTTDGATPGNWAVELAFATPDAPGRIEGNGVERLSEPAALKRPERSRHMDHDGGSAHGDLRHQSPDRLGIARSAPDKEAAPAA